MKLAFYNKHNSPTIPSYLLSLEAAEAPSFKPEDAGMHIGGTRRTVYMQM